MAQSRFSIGIDLGTTNCALAYVPLDGEAPSTVLEIPQWDSLSSLVSASTLPSFLYLPEPAVAEQIQGKAAGKGEWIVGRLARKRSGEAPERIAHSAKSWLCHHAADRSAAFLPWGSEAISEDRKISPIHATALILNYLRSAWNRCFDAAEYAFDAQQITVTVPASFDAVAQRLTLTAAEDAGFPLTVRLLEEPQAAFYRWLEQHGGGAEVWSHLPDRGGAAHHVLVLDIGGGTSDFSLFALSRDGASAHPRIRRIAVSDHILLGGDNMDLAIAHLLEPRLAGEEGTFSSGQWHFLVARCRDLKEKALSSEGLPDERFRVTIPGRGASLIAGALTTEITRGEIEQVLLAGFFPECDADERPYQTQVGLREWGLPYAADSAVTRHLADFLRNRPPVDAVLFNGGSLYPKALRRRICREITKWQQQSGAAAPVVLENAEPDLAVARGAACFGKIVHRKAARIEAGAARAVFLEAHRQPAGGSKDKDQRASGRRSLICILPRGAPPEQTFAIDELALQLRVNRPVRFQTYHSTRQGRTSPGELVEWNPRDFHPLPPLETVVSLPEDGRTGAGEKTLPVALTAKLNELGLLQVSCHSTDRKIRREWPLEFNLRPHEQTDADASHTDAASSAPLEPNAAPDALQAARTRIETVFSQPLNRREKLTATRLLASLEKILGLPKNEWNWALIRALWPSLETCMDGRKHSVDHEEAWLILASFLLRPGFGAPMDPVRIDSLWRLREIGLFFPGKRIKLQEYILWRRVAGGLNRERQESILEAELDKIRQQRNAPPELIRLAGSLERIDHRIKKELIERFIAAVVELSDEGKHCAPYLAALGLLLNRAPLYAGPEAVVPAELVVQAYDAFAPLDWSDPELLEVQTLFLRAARVVGNRSLDVPERRRYRIAARLEKAGLSPLKTAKLKDFMPIDRSERISLYGEALPPGLILSEN